MVDQLDKSLSDNIAVKVAAIAERLSHVRQTINRERKNWAKPDDVPRKAQEYWMLCSMETRTLQKHSNPHVRATAKAFELALFLSASKVGDGIIARVADELRAEMDGIPGRTCIYMDLTSCPLILGAVAAREGSETRDWFLGRLRRAVRAMRLRGWEDPFEALRRAVEADAELLYCLDDLREEICTEHTDGADS